MAAARQKEMKVSITVVATKTFTAGLIAGFSEAAMEEISLASRVGVISDLYEIFMALFIRL